MPKVKTNSGAKKTKKTKKQKRNLCGSTIVDVTNMKQVRDLLCLR